MLDYGNRTPLLGFDKQIGELALAAAAVSALSLALTCAPASIHAAFAEPVDATGNTPNAADTTYIDLGGASDSSASASLAPLYGDEKIEVDFLADQLKIAEASGAVADIKACAMRYHADAISARIPEQQQRSDQAARRLYKAQQSRYDMVEMLLSTESLDEFIRQVDYFQNVSESNIREIKRANELVAEAEQSQSVVDEKRKVADERVETARAALKSAQAARIEKAEQGIAKAQYQAGTLGGANSISKTTTDKKKGQKTSTVQAMTDTEPLDDGADWSMTKEEFVAEWAPRIDSYLEGSPLYGQGENFAKSAWKYCIDPRWSPAISFTESSKGAVCIRPHNAWGWGAADSDPYNLASEWGSWEEAIDAHARGLSNGYGYTITMAGAQAYCPYTWQSWYNRTLGQMALI